MDFLPVLLIGLGLSADCFAVALGGGVSIKDLNRRQSLRTAFFFGLFQFIMPVLGWLAGRTIVNIIAGFDHWVAFGLLAIVGGRMIWESLHSGKEKAERADVTRGLALLGLSLATSIDALAVGLSLAFLDINIIMASSTFGAVTFIVTNAGFLLSRKASRPLGERAELVGGIILIAIGLRIMLSHLLSG